MIAWTGDRLMERVGQDHGGAIIIIIITLEPNPGSLIPQGLGRVGLDVRGARDVMVMMMMMMMSLQGLGRVGLDVRGARDVMMMIMMMMMMMSLQGLGRVGLDVRGARVALSRLVGSMRGVGNRLARWWHRSPAQAVAERGCRWGEHHHRHH
jgi:hypothetical protein